MQFGIDQDRTLFKFGLEGHCEVADSMRLFAEQVMPHFSYL
jgi:hypothetical protein